MAFEVTESVKKLLRIVVVFAALALFYTSYVEVDTYQRGKNHTETTYRVGSSLFPHIESVEKDTYGCRTTPKKLARWRSDDDYLEKCFENAVGWTDAMVTQEDMLGLLMIGMVLLTVGSGIYLGKRTPDE